MPGLFLQVEVNPAFRHSIRPLTNLTQASPDLMTYILISAQVLRATLEHLGVR